MICPKCGEVNSSNFLFCGMCGTMLEPARKASAPSPTVAAKDLPQAAEIQSPAFAPLSSPVAVAAPPPAEPPRSRTVETVPSIGGPSLLGLDAPDSVDIVRERAFTSLESYDNEPKSRGTRFVLFLVLLAALGGAYWWVYTNYLRVADGRKPVALPTAKSDEPKPDSSTEAKTPSIETDLPVRSSKPAAVPTVTPEPPGKSARSNAASATTSEEARPQKTSRHEVTASRIPASTSAADAGDALFRQGERYLYGRGGAQDCAAALKFMKMASDKQNAKARSAMGTMYATGHCVTRDLPSAYRWFALSLRADPNNSVVEKNLSAVWNQMTPPERQLATRSQ